jgi:Flp pilus assembly pilin Flp
MLDLIRNQLGLPGQLRLGPPLIQESGGSTGVEYAIMLALLVVGMLASVQAVGSGTKSLLEGVSKSLNSAESVGGGFQGTGKPESEAPTTFF